MHIKTVLTIWRHEKWQECLHAELRALGFVLALCMCSLSLENKVGSWSQFSFLSLKHVDSLHSEWVGMSLIEPPWKKENVSCGWKCLWASVCTTTQRVKCNPVIGNVFESFWTMHRALFTHGSLLLEAWKATRVQLWCRIQDYPV